MARTPEPETGANGGRVYVGAEMRTKRNQSETDPNTHRIPGRRRAIRLIVPAFAGTFAVVALLLLATPFASAGALVTYKAPYTAGKLVQVRDPVAQGCGATLTVSKAATFSLTTGVATGKAAAKSVPCASADSQASYDGTVGVTGLTFTASASGTYNVVATWTVTWAAKASMNANAAANGAQATVEIFLVTKLIDTTAKKTTTATLFLVQKDFQSAGAFSKSGTNLTYLGKISGASLVSGHTYQLYEVLSYSCQTAMPQGSTAGSAVTASVDLGSTGFGGKLVSVTVG